VGCEAVFVVVAVAMALSALASWSSFLLGVLCLGIVGGSRLARTSRVGSAGGGWLEARGCCSWSISLLLFLVLLSEGICGGSFGERHVSEDPLVHISVCFSASFSPPSNRNQSLGL
jgi:hypothetical protein